MKKLILRRVYRIVKRNLKRKLLKSHRKTIAVTACVLSFTLGAMFTATIVNSNSVSSISASELTSVSNDFSKEDSVKTIKSVKIEKGDSLWTIAEKYYNVSGHSDLREYVKEIASTNSIKNINNIGEGNYIIVPMYVTK